MMLILIYFLWGQNANEDYIGANTLFFLALFSVVSFLLCLVIQFNKLKKDEESNRCDGTVKWYNPNKGFGFIEQDIGEDLFVHQTEIRQSGFRYLNLGDRVEYEVGKGKRGRKVREIVLRIMKLGDCVRILSEDMRFANGSNKLENNMSTTIRYWYK